MSRTAHTPLRITVSLGIALVIYVINTLGVGPAGVGERDPQDHVVLEVAAKAARRPSVAADAAPALRARVEDAIRRFEDAGLTVPPVEVTFSASSDSCDGYQGLFSPQLDPPRVTYCGTPSDWVFEHELAHAWVEFNVSEDTRKAFMDWRELESWNDHSGAWGRQGAEQAAFAIQQGVMGRGENPSTEHLRRLCGFQMLAGLSLPELDPAACRS